MNENDLVWKEKKLKKKIIRIFNFIITEIILKFEELTTVYSPWFFVHWTKDLNHF